MNGQSTLFGDQPREAGSNPEMEAAYCAAGEAVVGHLLGFKGKGVSLDLEGGAWDTSYERKRDSSKKLEGAIRFFQALAMCYAGSVALGFSIHGPEWYAVDAQPAPSANERTKVEDYALWVAARIIREHWTAVEVLAAYLFIAKKASCYEVATFIAKARKAPPSPIGGIVGGVIDNVVERAEWLRYGQWVRKLPDIAA